jgi:hypothetical protein
MPLNAKNEQSDILNYADEWLGFLIYRLGNVDCDHGGQVSKICRSAKIKLRRLSLEMVIG